jgi:ABC-2 type transport system permease protein
MANSKILTIVLIALAVLFGNHIVFDQLEGARFDMTQDNLYSLTEGTEQILDRMVSEGVKPVDIDLYFSETTGKTLPRFIKNFIAYDRYLRSLLKEYERAAQGRIRVHFIDPVTDSDEAQDALDFGLDGKPINQEGDLFFFGLVFQTQTGSRDIIEFLWPDRQETIEYEISKTLHALLWPSSRTVGVLSGLEVFGGADNPYLAQMLAAQGRQPPEKWVALQLLEEAHNVRSIDRETEHISPDEFDLVVVIHPKGLSDKALWALDEWVVRGGNTLIFQDPYALDDRPPQNPQQPWQALQYQPASNLGAMLAAWGLEMPANQFAADMDLAVRRAVDPRGGAESVLIDLSFNDTTRDQTLAIDHPVFEGLSELRFLMAGALRPLVGSEAEGVELTPLVTTTATGSTLTIEPGFGGEPGKLAYTDLSQPAKLRDAFVPGTESVVLGYQIKGRLPTAYPEGIDYPAETPETPPGLPPGVKLPPPEGAEMIHQDPVPDDERGEATVVVMSDVDVISDQIAFQRNFLGLTMATNDNHKLLLNLVDYLMGAEELMGIRAKHAIRRPFTLFDDIEDAAEVQTLERERQLREEVAAAEEELRQKRQEMSGQQAALFQKQVQEEVDRLNDRLSEANRELREIRKGRREALEREEAKVRFSVLGWMPILVLAVGIGLGLRRRRMHQEVTGGGQ